MQIELFNTIFDGIRTEVVSATGGETPHLQALGYHAAQWNLTDPDLPDNLYTIWIKQTLIADEEV